MLPLTVQCLFQNNLDWLQLLLFFQRLRCSPGCKRSAVSFHHLLHHQCRRNSRQIGAARRSCQRQSQTNQIMRRISDDGLVQIANLNLDLSFRIRYRPKIARMTIPADPHRRPLGQPICRPGFQPLVKLRRIAAYIRVRRSRHLQPPPICQNRQPVRRTDLKHLLSHPPVLSGI